MISAAFSGASAPLVGPLGRQGDRLGAPSSARARRPPARTCRLALPRRSCRSSRRSRACWQAAATRCCSPYADDGAFERLGSTLDDAAGEAFDKGARLLGLGYPGGAEIERLARDGDPGAWAFPVARVPGLDFSFSGLKTALLYAVRDLSPASSRAGVPTSPPPTSARSCRALTGSPARCGRRNRLERVAVVGGVAANSRAAGGTARRRICSTLAVHRQRGHDRVARATTALPYPDYLGLDAYASSAWHAVVARRGRVALRARCSRGAAGADEAPQTGAAGWESLLGDRPAPQLGGRWIVVLGTPSLATRVAAAGGTASEEQERAWTAAARRASAT